MDLRKVKKLIELAEEAGLAELGSDHGDESVRIAFCPSFKSAKWCRTNSSDTSAGS